MRCVYLLPVILIASAVFAAPPRTAEDDPASFLNSGQDNALIIENQIIDEESGLPGYLVQLILDPDELAPGAARQVVQDVIAASIDPQNTRFIYEYAIVGFGAWMTHAQAEMLQDHPLVKYVEPDFIVTMDGNEDEGDPDKPNTWGLRRISDPDELAPAFDPCGADGTGVTVVIIDSGIALDHTEFTGRIKTTVNFNHDGVPDGADSGGHGTHVASTVAGSTVGVAPGAEIIALRVFGGTPASTANIVAALDWTANPNNVTPPAVVNMSLGGVYFGQTDQIYRDVLYAVLNKGIPNIVAAGNDAYPAHWAMPAATAATVTVGATDIFDKPTLFTNYGQIVDIWAPGEFVLGADFERTDNGFLYLSGTSMASPHACGVAALYLQRNPPTPVELKYYPANITQRTRLSLIQSASKDVLEDYDDVIIAAPHGNGILGGSPNLLLQACEKTSEIVCDDQQHWSNGTQSITLGDGATQIPAEFTCFKRIYNPDGIVTLYKRAVSILPQFLDGQIKLAAEVEVFDTATGEELQGDVITAPTKLGLTIIWTPHPEAAEAVGYGYAYFATLEGNCSTDFNNDGVVDGIDLGLLFTHWGPCIEGMPCLADINQDLEVNGADLGLFFTTWGACPDWIPPGYIRDCNGNFVPGSLLGDNIVDNGIRHYFPSQYTNPNASVAINLACPELMWDTLDNGYTIMTTDPRIGACSIPGNGCVQTTYGECAQQGGHFWGQDIDCSDVAGTTADIDLTCNGTLYGDYADMQFPAQFGKFTKGAIWKQPTSPGLSSISQIRFVAQVHSASNSKTQTSPPSLTGNHGLVHLGRIFRVTIEFEDGNTPFVADLPATSYFVGDDIMLYELNDVLKESNQEVASIAIQVKPDEPYLTSNHFRFSWLGSIGLDGPGGEFSRDGGRTWQPILHQGESFHPVMCVQP